MKIVINFKTITQLLAIYHEIEPFLVKRVVQRAAGQPTVSLNRVSTLSLRNKVEYPMTIETLYIENIEKITTSYVDRIDSLPITKYAQ